MDFQNNSQSELGKLEQIVSQFLLKSLHIILDSRIPSIRRRSGDLTSASRVRKSDKWFNLVLGDRPEALENLNFWHRNLMDPMIIDIILVQEKPCSSSVENIGTSSSTTGASVETVIERWVVQYESPRFMAPQVGDNSVAYKKTYKKSIILLRSLYSQMRLLPAYRVFQQLNSSSQTFNFDIIYKVSSFCDPFSRVEEQVMKEYTFVPVEALPGRLCISVTYHPTLSEFNLDLSTSLAAKIITDYVGSPTIDPLRSFPSTKTGFPATSFQLRRTQPPSPSPFQRPHSWTSGFQRAVPYTQNQSLGGSPPTYPTSPMVYDSPSPPTDTYNHRVQNYRQPAYQKATSFDEYQLSPPFSSSPSPSPPTYISGGNTMQSRLRSESAPVSIPLPITGRSSKYIYSNFSDPSRHSLPPPSPRSTRHDPSSQESPSGTRSIRRTEALRPGEHPGITNQYSGQKVVKDSKDDSGRFSGFLSSSGSPRIGFSRSSSRLSFQDDLDHCDFSCPFDVDDVDPSDSQASHNLGGRKSSDYTSQSLPPGGKSQEAAVGVLVHMLRTAPPLRQDSSSYSTHSKSEFKGEPGSASDFFMPRKTADALEELRSYIQMKDMLLSKSGNRLMSKEAQTQVSEFHISCT